MTAKIQQHRGLEKDLPILAEGQIGFTTDTKRIFIGSKDGNVEITNEADFKAIKQILDEGIKELSQKVNASDKATTAQAQTGVDDNTFMTPLKFMEALDYNGFMRRSTPPVGTDFNTLEKAGVYNCNTSTYVNAPVGYPAQGTLTVLRSNLQTTGNIIQIYTGGNGIDAKMFFRAKNASSGKWTEWIALNQDKATTVQAQAGTDDETYMTPLKNYQFIDSQGVAGENFLVGSERITSVKGSSENVSAEGVATIDTTVNNANPYWFSLNNFVTGNGSNEDAYNYMSSFVDFGENIVMSLDYEVVSGDLKYPTIYFHSQMGYLTMTSDKPLAVGKKVKIYVTRPFIKKTSGIAQIHMNLPIGVYKVSNFKIEKGYKPTQWNNSSRDVALNKNRIGDMTALKTTARLNLVESINEVNELANLSVIRRGNLTTKDLNEVVDAGVYNIATNTLPNFPTGAYGYGTLTVLKANPVGLHGITQIYAPHAEGALYFRTFWQGSNWRGWTKVGNDANVKEINDLGIGNTSLVEMTTGDANTISKGGVYALSGAITNAPTGGASLLFHMVRGTTIASQIGIVLSTNTLYTRTKVSNVWSNWVKLTTNASALIKYDTLPTKADLNEYVEAGVYNTQNDNYANAPTKTYSAQGTLTVLTGNGNNITQFLVGGNGTGTNTFYFRTKNASSNTWSNWLSVGDVRTDGSTPMQNITIGSRKANSVVGLNSFAQGSNVESSSNQSHAIGYETVASGQQSHAEGWQTVASGYRSHAEGYITTASANQAHAEGSNTDASGINSHAEGTLTIASASSAHAEGNTTTASGSSAHSEGYNTIAEGNNSHAEGSYTKATANNSHAEGSQTTASGLNSHAEGDQTKASSSGSHAEGNQTSATGVNSHAEGRLTVASGATSHAEGDNTTASGSVSHAEGGGTIASGNYSHSEGYFTTASDHGSHAGGALNKAMTGNATAFSISNTAYVIGNGTTTANRSNAFRVMFNGATYGLSAFNSTGADYAEFFEWLDGNPENEDRVGYVVSLDGEKIRLANEDDEILGVISANPSVIGDSYQDDWQGRYELDKWGRKIIEEYEYEETVIEDEEYEETYTETITEYVEEEQIETYLDDEGEEQQNVIKVEVPVEREVTRTEVLIRPKEVKVIRRGTRFKENAEWNNENEYIPREQRKEWDAVGLIGKLLVRTDGTLQVNGFAKVGNNGALTHSDERTNIQVMSIVDNDIARVFIK